VALRREILDEHLSANAGVTSKPRAERDPICPGECPTPGRSGCSFAIDYANAAIDERAIILCRYRDPGEEGG